MASTPYDLWIQARDERDALQIELDKAELRVKQASRKVTEAIREERGGLLTISERKVYKFLMDNLQLKEIAHNLNTSERTVKFHCTNIYKKFGVAGRMELLTLTAGDENPTGKVAQRYGGERGLRMIS